MPRRTWVIVVGGAVLIAALAGCSNDSPVTVSADQATTTGPVEASVPASEPAPAGRSATSSPAGDGSDLALTPVGERVEPAAIELLDAGAEPRVPLRLALVPGSTQHQAMTITMDLPPQDTAAGATGAPSTPVPADDADVVTVDLVTTVIAVGDDGVARVHSRQTSDMSGMSDTLDPSLGALGSLPGTDQVDITAPPVPSTLVDELLLDLDARDNLIAGVSRDLSDPATSSDGWSVSEGALADAGTNPGVSFDGLASFFGIPFPEEAVGVGARWRIVAPDADRMDDIEEVLERVVELTALDGTRATLIVRDRDTMTTKTAGSATTTASGASPASPTGDEPATDPFAEYTVTTQETTATVVFDLTLPLPVEIDVEMVGTASDPFGTAPAVESIRMHGRLTSAP